MADRPGLPRMSRFAIAAVLAASPSAGADLLLGGDVSMLPRLEAAGAVYRERGRPADALHILGDRGANAFRVRLFVDPAKHEDGAIQDLSYALDLARRIGAAGATLVLDPHYSDTWADPGRQTKPAAWSALDFAGLEARVESWTAETVAAFAAAGCAPDYVQIGNEITAGFLWPEGRLGPRDEGWDRLAALLKAGVSGVRRAHPGARIVLHVDAGGDAERTAWFFRHVEAHGIPFDVIGISYYPWWHGEPAALEENLRKTAAEFGRDILLVETAYPWRADDASGTMPWPPTPDGQRAFLEDVIRIVRGSPHGLGVLWWGPETIPAPGVTVWKGGAAALFDAEGCPLPALEAFRPDAPPEETR